MIIDLEKFLQIEEPYWHELEQSLRLFESKGPKSIEAIGRIHYLYERASASLAQIQTYSSDPEVSKQLELLIGRAYGVIHSNSKSDKTFRPIHWFMNSLPQTFRRQGRSFAMAMLVTFAGVLFGWLAVMYDYDYAKPVTMVFGHGQMDPAKRVEKEETNANKIGAGQQGVFAAHLMTHNIEVSILAFALGATFGLGTIVLLFYNGVILGAVCYDYIQAGQGEFLAGWLLPHGSVEIPAILIGAQAGFVLAKAFIGWSDRTPTKIRLQRVIGDIRNLIIFLVILLIWAGIIEAFFSQYHEPVIPYWVKITFGSVQLALLAGYLAFAGWAKPDSKSQAEVEAEVAEVLG